MYWAWVVVALVAIAGLVGWLWHEEVP